MSESIKTDNVYVKRMSEILEPHFDELLGVMESLPRHNVFWDYMECAIYNLAISKGKTTSIAKLAKLMNMNRTTLHMAMKRLGFIRNSLDP
jgi:hypothetical protein